jgi:hypothetical protein
MIASIRGNERPCLHIEHREPRDIFWKINDGGPHTVLLKQFRDIGYGGITNPQATPLLLSNRDPLSDGIESGARRGQVVTYRRSRVSVDSDQPLEVRQFTPNGHTVTKCAHRLRIIGDVAISAEQAGQGIFRTELSSEESANIPPIKEREAIEFQAAYRSSSVFDECNGRPRDAKLAGDLILSQAREFTGVAQAGAKFCL